jgi:RNA-binding protein
MISKKAIAHLRALGHALDPVVQIGKSGISPALVRQATEQLVAHELIKVRVATEAPIDRKEAAASLATETGAVLAQIIGRTFLLYKAPTPKKGDKKVRKPKIELPTEKPTKGGKKSSGASKGPGEKKPPARADEGGDGDGDGDE